MAVIFPEGFIQIRHPGYFWHPESETLYSLKSGILKPLVINKYRGEKFCGKVRIIKDPNFSVSVNGRRFRLSRRWLKLDRYKSIQQKIKISHDSVQRKIPDSCRSYTTT